MAEFTHVTVKSTSDQKVLVLVLVLVFGVSGYFNADLVDQFCSSYQFRSKFHRYPISMDVVMVSIVLA